MEYHGIEFKDDFNLNELSFSNVIDGLNKYFSEAETQRVLQPFIEVKGDKVIFYRFNAEMYLDKLITWLRTKHGIFYYPGMESKYAKAEKMIPPFSERMKNDGALNTLKKLHKLVTGVEVSDKADSPTLIAAAIETDFAVLKQDLKNALEAKESFFETKGKLNYRKELMEYIVKTEKKYGICFSDLHDDEEFRPERIFDDLLDKMTRNEHIIKDLYRDILHRQPDGLSNEDIATKILDKVLETKERLDHKEAKVVGEIRVKQYEEELLNYIYKEYEHRINLSDKTITYNPPSIRDTITKIISDYARNRTRVDILETRIKSIFDKYKAKFTIDDYVLNDEPTSMFMLDCINAWIRSSTELKEKCDFLENDLGKEAVVRKLLDRRRMTKAKLDTIEKKLEELLKDIKEELP